MKDIKDENYCQDLEKGKGKFSLTTTRKKGIINDSKVKLTLVAEWNLTMNQKEEPSLP